MPVLNVALPPLPGGSIVVPGGGRVEPVETLPVPATPTQEEVWSFTRFHVALPVLVQEQALVIQTSETNNFTRYQTAEEASKAAENFTGGKATITGESKTISFEGPYEEVTGNTEYSVSEGVGLRVRHTLTTKRSLLPIEVTVILQLIGSEGVLWSSSFNIPVRWAGAGTPGIFTGTGYADEYVDLVNPITVLSGQPLSVSISVRIPAAVSCRFAMPDQVNAKGDSETVPATVLLYYDPLPRSDYPIKRGGAR